MKRLALLCLALLTAGPAFALSCARPSVEQAFMQAHEAPEIYVPVLGHFEGFSLRPPKKTRTPEARSFIAQFKGDHLSPTGKDRMLRINVTITETCLSAWCGQLTPDQPLLTFLRRTETGYEVTFNACSSNLFANPTAQQVQSIRSCMAQGRC